MDRDCAGRAGRARHARLVTTLAATAALLAPAGAAAAERHAAPAGSGTACTQQAPCGVVEAVSRAASGDEVILAPGDYALSQLVDTSVRVAIHGVEGQPAPRLLFAPGVGGVRLDAGISSLRHVEVHGSSSTLIFASGGVVDRVLAVSSTPSGVTANIQSRSVISNSIVVATGARARAVQTSTNGAQNYATYRSVTAVASADDGIAVEALALGTVDKPGLASVTMTNVLAVGGPNGADVLVSTGSQGATAATVTAEGSRYATVVQDGTNATATAPGTGTNIADAPAFADAAAGDYRQAPGSKTIDAGVDDPLNGTLDFGGDPRTLGEAIDIGADEYVPPPAPPAPDDPSSPVDPATTDDDASAQPSGAGEAPGTVAVASATTPFAGVTLGSRRLRADGRRVRVTLRCPAGTAGGCSGRVTMTARMRRADGKRTARVTIATRRFALAPGAREVLRIRLTRRGRELLAVHATLRGRVRVVAGDRAGSAKATATAVRIRRQLSAKGAVA